MDINNKIPFKEARLLVREGDLLFCYPQGIFNKLWTKITKSKYCHVALTGTGSDCIEFHYKYGGVNIPLKDFVRQRHLIDVYRPTRALELAYYKDKKVRHQIKVLNTFKIVKRMKELVGLSYGWPRILWWIIQYVPFFRLFYNIQKLTNDKNNEGLIYPVCSSSIAYCFAMEDFDLVYNMANTYVTPKTLSQSSLIHYLFTIDVTQ